MEDCLTFYVKYNPRNECKRDFFDIKINNELKKQILKWFFEKDKGKDIKQK